MKADNNPYFWSYFPTLRAGERAQGTVKVVVFIKYNLNQGGPIAEVLLDRPTQDEAMQAGTTLFALVCAKNGVET